MHANSVLARFDPLSFLLACSPTRASQCSLRQLPVCPSVHFVPQVNLKACSGAFCQFIRYDLSVGSGSNTYDWLLPATLPVK